MKKIQPGNIESHYARGKSTLFFLIFLTCFFVKSAECQDTAKHEDNIIHNQERELVIWESQPYKPQSLIPNYFTKDSAKGSPYLSTSWMRGVLELSDHRRVPNINEYLYFNYDKYNLRVILINKENKISSYPADSVFGFVLMDGDKVYSFEKIPFISDKLFFESVLRSEKGYSLYKRLITRLVSANYVNEGYWSKGTKYDEYVDEYEYYLVSPDKQSYRKFYLSENAIQRAFKKEIILRKNYFKPPVTEYELISFVELVNNSIVNRNK